MAKDVDAVLREVVACHGNMTSEVAENYVKALSAAKCTSKMYTEKADAGAILASS